MCGVRGRGASAGRFEEGRRGRKRKEGGRRRRRGAWVGVWNTQRPSPKILKLLSKSPTRHTHMRPPYPRPHPSSTRGTTYARRPRVPSGSMPLQLFEFTDLPLQFIISELCHYNFTTLSNTPLLTLFIVFLKKFGPKYPGSSSSSNPLYPSLSMASESPMASRARRALVPCVGASIILGNGMQTHPVMTY